jgi:hypothetical protein
MAFDLNKNGAIASNPLVFFESAIVADAICLLRLVLARPEDRPQTGSIAVQLTLSAPQANELVLELQKMLGRIEAAKSSARAH